jgi:hypothetical protein
MTTEVQQQPAEPSPGRANFKPEAHTIFTYGGTKCAVILKDMVDKYDRRFGGRKASKYVGGVFAKLDEMLDLVSLKYAQLTEARKKGNLFQQQEKGGFKEHLVYEAAQLHGAQNCCSFPTDMLKMLDAVCRERINIRKSDLGVQPHKIVGYKTKELFEWLDMPKVKAARIEFGKSLAGGFVTNTIYFED